MTTLSLGRLRDRGIALFRASGELRFRARPGSMTPELRTVLMSKGPELLGEIETEVACRVAVMRSQVPLKGPIPLLVARREGDSAGCVSCGISQMGSTRCELCIEAAATVLADAGIGSRADTLAVPGASS